LLIQIVKLKVKVKLKAIVKDKKDYNTSVSLLLKSITHNK